MNLYILVCTLISLFDPGFRGSHRDVVMQAPAAAHTSCEDGDPRPCAEDENFFESRPDAEDMEKDIEVLKKERDSYEERLKNLSKSPFFKEHE